MTEYDLILKGGNVIDPGQGLNGRLDVAITNGRIAAISEDIPADLAKRVIQIVGDNRYITPGLIDIHTHVAYGATTLGVGMACCDPDDVGVRAGITTVADGGSVGVANIGVFAAHIIPRSTTRIVPFLNLGNFAHTTPIWHDMSSMNEVDRVTIAACIEANPTLVQGLKLRLVGPVAQEEGIALVDLALDIARENGLVLMVHVGDRTADLDQHTNPTRHLLTTLQSGDILTHMATPHPGGPMELLGGGPMPELLEARERGVVLDAAQGRTNFSFDVARQQAELGIHPDTLSSDITAEGQRNGAFSLLECIGRYMAIGYSLEEVVKMTTHNAARALGLQKEIGSLAVGREADISLIEVVEGDWVFQDSIGKQANGDFALTPIITLRAGDPVSPGWGPHPWGWLPIEAVRAGH